MGMNVACLDLEGVLVPEIWIAFSKASGIDELKITTRDEPDYDKLMNFRLKILKEHGLGLKEIQDTIDKIDPLDGAKEFLDELRDNMQTIIISDTFEQFAKPLMKKLGMPTIFCNSLIVGDDGMINGYKMRCEKSKLTTVKALQSFFLFLDFYMKDFVGNMIFLNERLDEYCFILKVHTIFLLLLWYPRHLRTWRI